MVPKIIMTFPQNPKLPHKPLYYFGCEYISQGTFVVMSTHKILLCLYFFYFLELPLNLEDYTYIAWSTKLFIFYVVFFYFISALELTGPNFRTVTGVVYPMFYSIGYSLVPVIAYFVRDYRKLLLIICGPNVVCLLFYW